jgi:hypothetical protein
MKREFKAVRLTLAIIGMYIVLWLPHHLGRGFQLVGNTQPFVAYLIDVGSFFGLSNSCFNWILYAGVSPTYQKVFKRLLTKAFLAIAKCCSSNRIQD